VHNLNSRYQYSIILLKQLVKTDFKLRYQGSALGYVWSLLRPLLIFLILYLVFVRLLKVGTGIPHYPVYLLTGIVLWNYFAEVTGGGVGAIVGRGDLLRKLNFPKYVIILAGSFSAFINLLINFVVIAIFMAAEHVSLTAHALIMIPLIIELFVVSIAAAFFLSALFVRYRDVSYIWEVIMQAAFYGTPILYPLTRIPHKYTMFLILNPMAQIIQDSRHVLVTPASQTIYQVYNGNAWFWAIPIGITVVVAILSMTYFRNRSKYFAEEI
jgi:ABC-2 type transport system permease protein